MARTLFFCMVFRKLSEITNNKPVFSQYNIFYKYISFFQSVFWSLFNHHQKSQSNQEQCILCCSSLCFRVLLCTHYAQLQRFSTYCSPYFQTVISCDYGFRKKLMSPKNVQTDRRKDRGKDGPTLSYRTLLAEDRGPSKRAVMYLP